MHAGGLKASMGDEIYDQPLVRRRMKGRWGEGRRRRMRVIRSTVWSGMR